MEINRMNIKKSFKRCKCMHVIRFKGNNSGIHVQAWLFKKD